MKKFNIKVISSKPEDVDGILSLWGQITIGDFNERFVIPLDNWNIEIYKAQWKKGLERIKSHNSSCLVTSITNLNSDYPSIELWSLYKEKNDIFFQNSLLIDETIEHSNMKLSDFNANTCYQYINHHRKTITEDGALISEWNIDIEDFFKQI